MRPVPLAPIQFGSFGVEALVVALLTVLVPAFLALWVMLDAKGRTDHPLAWGLTVLLGGLTPLYVGAVAVTVLYWLSREELGSIPPPEVSGDDVQRGEVLGKSTVTGMGPGGQARWEGRTDAGLRANGGPDESQDAEDGKRGETERTDGDAAEAEPAVGGFEMADPVDDA